MSKDFIENLADEARARGQGQRLPGNIAEQMEHAEALFHAVHADYMKRAPTEEPLPVELGKVTREVFSRIAVAAGQMAKVSCPETDDAIHFIAQMSLAAVKFAATNIPFLPPHMRGPVCIELIRQFAADTGGSSDIGQSHPADAAVH